LHAALAYARTEWIFVTACDYPFISIELIKYLKDRISEDFDAIVPVQPDERVQPLITFYRTKSCLAAAEDLLRPNRSTPPLRAIFDHVRTKTIPFADMARLPNAENFFANINTPGDLERIPRSEADSGVD
jgi:molybdenum cofactor guanylyltransferase